MISTTLSCNSVIGLDLATNAAIVTKAATPPMHIRIARIDLPVEGVLAQPGVEDRGDHQRQRTERLDHDQGRQREAGELEQDREPEQHGADHPGRPPQQREQRADAEPALLLAVELLDPGDTAVLELRTRATGRPPRPARPGCRGPSAG